MALKFPEKGRRRYLNLTLKTFPSYVQSDFVGKSRFGKSDLLIGFLSDKKNFSATACLRFRSEFVVYP